MAGEDRSGQVLAVAIIFFTLSWITVSLRVYVKKFMIKAFGNDDTAMLVTLAFFTIYLICQLGGVAHGTGRHRADLLDSEAQTALKYWLFCEVFYTLSTCSLKVAIGLFLLRFAVERIHIWIIRLIMILAAIIGAFYAPLMLFQCKPISYWWDLSPDAHGTCISANVIADILYLVSALNSAADWIFGVLPIFMVRKLQMPAQTKAVVMLLLGFAAIGSTATIIRMPYIYTMKHYKGEFLWRTTDVAIWTTVEVGIGITAGSFATLRPLLQRLFSILNLTSSKDSEDRSGTRKTSRISKLHFGKKSQSKSQSKSQNKSQLRSHAKLASVNDEGQVMEDLNFGGAKEGTTTRITAKSKQTNGLSWAEVSNNGSEEDVSSGSPSEHDKNEFESGFGMGGITKAVDITVEETSPLDPVNEMEEEQPILTKPTPASGRV